MMWQKARRVRITVARSRTHPGVAGGEEAIPMAGVSGLDQDQRLWTVNPYLDLERTAEERHAYLDGCVYPWGQARTKAASAPRW